MDSMSDNVKPPFPNDGVLQSTMSRDGMRDSVFQVVSKSLRSNYVCAS